MTEPAQLIAFVGSKRVTQGPLAHVLAVLKERFDRDNSDQPLVFEVESGKQVDFDLTGSPAEVQDRAVAGRSRSPGRPRLGVLGREVSLLPRHWEWLEQQSQGVSGALRRLVEQAMQHQPGKENARRIRAALSHFLSSMGGNRPNYEEATRSLFQGDTARFEELIHKWPKDIRDFAVERARLASQVENDEMSSPQPAK